jgi:selenocysteine lyase/cysteine desulfurase
MTPLDLARLRADTPACERLLHLNNAGASLPPRPVLDAVIGHLRLEAEIGGYEAADRAAERIEAVYGSIARLINCGPDEIALVENATRAWDMAFYGLDLAAGRRILTAEAEYASNVIAFLQVARRSGVEIAVVPSDRHGQLDVAALERMIDARTALIAVTHVPTNGGLVNPAAEIGAVARRHGVPFLLDACQSVGQLPVDVAAIGCDMLSATGRKYLRGPRGTGFLYVRREWIGRLEPPFLDLHAARWTARDAFEVRPDARRFENWESYVAGRLGLGAAVDYALALGMERIAASIGSLAVRLRDGLGAIPGVVVQDRGLVRSGIVSFTKDGEEPAEIRQRLQAAAVNVSVSRADSTRIDMEKRGLAAVVRASVHCYNSEAEIDRFCALLAGGA